MPEDLATDKEFLRFLANTFDKENRRVFDIILRADSKVAIKARNYVGVFVIKDSRGRDIALVVEPKIGVRNVIRMLAFCEAKNLKELKEIESLLSIEGDSVLDLLVISVLRKFLKRLNDALVCGFLELPEMISEEGIVIRGRIKTEDIPKSLLMNSIPKISYLVEVSSLDNIVNNYILSTCYALYTNDTLSQLMQLLLGEKYTIIARVLLELGYDLTPYGGMNKVEELLSIIPIDRPYLHELVRLSSIIKNHIEYGYTYLSEFTSIPAIYINMNDLFEKYVIKLFTEAANYIHELKGVEIIVRPAHKKEKPLVVSPQSEVYLEPDIVVKVGDKCIAVGDVKYRLVRDPLKSDRDSINQIYTFMGGWNVDKGFLVYPSLDNKFSYEKYKFVDNKILYIIKTYVEDEEYIVTELAQFLEKIISDDISYK